METSIGSPNSFRSSSGGADAGANDGGQYRRYTPQFSPSNFLHSPIAAILEYSGILRHPNHPENESLVDRASSELRDQTSGHSAAPTSSAVGGEVSIQIIGSTDQDSLRVRNPQQVVVGEGRDGISGDSGPQQEFEPTNFDPQGSSMSSESTEGESRNSNGGNNADSSYQRYDIQQAARWIEQILPFSLLLLLVFIRQHLQGFFVTIWTAAVLFKSNDIMRKQTALKGERRLSILIGVTIIFSVHVVGIYWWCRNEDVLYPLIMLPPKEIPPFWHAVFLISLNDTMVRQAAMVVKCLLLIYYKNSCGPNYRRQGQMLTLVEYFLLFYRSLLPTPVWYRFFLNKEYGSLFSSLTTGLYLTFKLTSVVDKVQRFLAALRAFSCKEVHYGCCATAEQVAAAGDMCAICQEKMQAPILLRCKHVFCEDCVSEWFERERTCPLCRATVKPADIRSFGDGSTSLFFQLF